MAAMTARSRIRQLIITCRHDIDREALVEVTRDQWQAQGILRSPRSEAWLRMLHGIWPDVAPGSQLAFVVRGGEAFWYRASAAQTLYPARAVGGVQHRAAIWLDPRTAYPELRQQLIGGTP
jgi:hypothetical protein